ncbi:MAG: hypothetical protein H0U89_00810 [Acidimicrobiia bacterium]|nr:hypothetical protein [Acidimicrobiia bacterium]
MDVLALAEELLALPTAPFVEDLPAAYALRHAEATPGVTGERDAAGNVVLRAGPVDSPHPTLVLVAHLDHPGFAVDDVDGSTVTLTFRGGLAAEAAQPGTPVDLFERGCVEATGRARLRSPEEDGGRLTGASAEVEDGEPVEGGFAMWAFPELGDAGVRIDDGRIVGRVCDDLAGAAAVLRAVGLAAEADAQPVIGLLTRAEEVGLLGALEAARLGTVPPDALVLSLECSKALPTAPQGAGVVVRVGDRATIFDPGFTAELCRRAAAVDGLRWQRKLMDGGVCEASAFGAAGWRTGGLALPLGNYHNAADDGSGIAPEHVLTDDLLAEVGLLEALVVEPIELGAGPPAWLADRAVAARAALGSG